MSPDLTAREKVLTWMRKHVQHLYFSALTDEEIADQLVHILVDPLAREIQWTNGILDRYGAPTTIYNYYDGVDQPLNLAGRISMLLDPNNEGGWKKPSDLLAERDELVGIILEWWADPDNPPVGAARIARQEKEISE